MNTTEFKTENLAALRELRIQEKAIKAQIDIVKPLAIEEAKNLAPKDGGKFSIDGVGEFVLDVVPVYDLADYRRYKEEEAKQWRCNRREQRIARTTRPGSRGPWRTTRRPQRRRSTGTRARPPPRRLSRGTARRRRGAGAAPSSRRAA